MTQSLSKEDLKRELDYIKAHPNCQPTEVADALSKTEGVSDRTILWRLKVLEYRFKLVASKRNEHGDVFLKVKE